MDSKERLNDLIELTESLVNLVMQENRALHANKATEVTAMLEKKKELCRIYEARIQNLGKAPEQLANADPEQINMLRELGEKANLMLEENARLLKISIEANRRVVDMVAEAVKSQQPGPGTYSAKGTTAKKDVHAMPRNVALSLDQSL